LASAQLHTNQLDGALSTAKELNALESEDLRSTYLLALAFFGRKDWAAAKSNSERVLAEHSDDREMNLILADIDFNNDRNFLVEPGMESRHPRQTRADLCAYSRRTFRGFQR
jgi:hypothetical protein